ncbi:MAG: hypothetical protein HY752_08470 [Nitrospirae bacterium]|nr:hypothetical protein [Nitrospirota bacterium]
MKILYLLKQEPDETLKKFIDEHKKANEVTIIDINKNKNYDEVVDSIFAVDKVIAW